MPEVDRRTLPRIARSDYDLDRFVGHNASGRDAARPDVEWHLDIEHRCNPALVFAKL
ncbi:hypothetical protein U8C45_36105 (plasmid) [Sinorhizobium meliloti]|nr:hypothetical protein [Sinorhizobium meliloti]MDE3768709.1 hypothetical protein [Sinorhizobium meliloti]MDE3777724.1 hypothetical protein [Sinorhizobium meliloti]MDE3787838.1 hypothetical protein [Sinorhizobium meliloti]MDE4553306.1 hypothetical protein [Sinorhizobium meliloti]MDE4599690.1 hypothetical protein [Sinorhizobium meliloti]